MSVLGHPFQIDESLRRWSTEGDERVRATIARVLRCGGRQSMMNVIDGPTGRYHHALYEPC
jgi:hypothetical protein